jgi:hypothetical protein
MDTIAIDRPTESGLPIDSQDDSQPGGRWQPTVDGHGITTPEIELQRTSMDVDGRATRGLQNRLWALRTQG